MSKSNHRKRRHAKALQTPRQKPEDANRIDNKPVRRDAQAGRNLLDRLLDTPQLEQVVPRLQPELLHRVIESCGLEDCGEILALATPEQLTRVFDLDLWRAARPGLDEQFDADRFGLWLEVLLEAGAGAAAEKLAKIDAELVIAGLAQHAFVYDNAAVSSYETTSGEVLDYSYVIADGLRTEIGGYLLVARREESWEAIITVLLSLDEQDPQFFHRVLGGCRALSSSKPEIDGLDSLFLAADQDLFDLAVDRERRREEQGYVTPAQARAFLQTARELELGSDSRPLANPVAGAYFRALAKPAAAAARNAPERLEAGAETPKAAEESTEAVAAVVDLLLEAGIITPPPRALLAGSDAPAARLALIQGQMQFLLDSDRAAYAAREAELAYLANTLISGCSIKKRPFTAQEASDAAIAVCNLGLENWPRNWLPASAPALPASFLIDQDLIGVFQVGWKILHDQVGMFTAERLIEVLAGLCCNDRETQADLVALRRELEKECRAGTPWRAGDALEVLAILDLPAWTALLALLDECPLLHACINLSGASRTLSLSASDCEFISENSQIASVREFMRRLPETLRT